MKIDILAAGYFKNNPLKQVFDYYHHRIPWGVTLQELPWDTVKNAEQRLDQFRKNYPQCPLILLDEKGKNINSIEFSQVIDTFQQQGTSRMAFIIGGPDGFSPYIRSFSSLKIAFGNVTWPHLMMRIMLIEQIYRSYQILHHHPYHRDS